MQTASSRLVEILPSNPFDLMHKVNQAKVFAIAYGLQQNRTRAVSEDDAGGAIGEIGHGGVHIRANYQLFPMRSTLNQFCPGGQSIDKAAAAGRDIVAPRVGNIALALH